MNTRGWVGLGEAVDTIPSILNKCLFVSQHTRTDGRTSRKQYAPHFFKVGGIKKIFYVSNKTGLRTIRMYGTLPIRFSAYL